MEAQQGWAGVEGNGAEQSAASPEVKHLGMRLLNRLVGALV